MKSIPILLIFLSFLSCKEKQSTLTAQRIVDQAIKISCQGHCDHAAINFDFRGRHYASSRAGGKYQLERIIKDTTGIIHDILTNEGFRRLRNDSLQQLPDSISTQYANSVNSVHYFAQLPYGLNAPAVKKELLGEAIIKGKEYFEVGVHFAEEGGGTDFEDRFVYWIQKDTYKVDYLAYSYVVNGGGIRFREAYNERFVEGIRFVDYNNYMPNSKEVLLTELDALFEAGSLKLLSKIETEEVKVALK